MNDETFFKVADSKTIPLYEGFESIFLVFLWMMKVAYTIKEHTTEIKV